MIAVPLKPIGRAPTFATSLSGRLRLMNPTSPSPVAARVIAAAEPVSLRGTGPPGGRPLRRPARAGPGGGAPPPPVALYWPANGSGVGRGGAATPHVARTSAASGRV